MICNAGLSDCHRMAILERCAFSVSEAYSERFFEELISMDGAITLVDYDLGKMRGFAIAIPEGRRFHVVDIVVDSESRRRGVGKLLLNSIEQRIGEGISSVYAEVRAGNDPSIKCFLSCGYKDVGRVDSYYDDPQEDAVMLEKLVSERIKVSGI